MNKHEFQQHWATTLRDNSATPVQYEALATGVELIVQNADEHFKEHLKNRSGRVSNRTGCTIDPQKFNLDMAKAYIADELGFGGWDELLIALTAVTEGGRSMLFHYAVAAMDRGDFSGLESAIGKDAFFDQICAWYDAGAYRDEPDTFDELLSASCMLGQTNTAAYLLDHGIDPYAGMRSWLAGPHYAVSSGRLEVVEMLLEKKIPLEVENKYGGTMLGQALWSAINEHMEDHAAIIEHLIAAGSHIWPNTLEWWEGQDVPSPETKRRVAEALRGTHMQNS